MRIVLVSFFLLLSLAVIADEPQTQSQPHPSFTIKADDSKHVYNKQDFPAGTFEGLNDVEIKQTLEVLNSSQCTCGCHNDTIAQCRIKDPNCSVAPKLISQVIGLIRDGKNGKEIETELEKNRSKTTEPENVEIPEQEATFIPFRKDDPYQGPLYAKVTIVDFSEFQCPFCRMVLPTIEELKKIYGENVKIVWKHHPLPFHSNAVSAAEAAEAAREQGKFWEMHDLLFKNQSGLTASKFEELATTIGLDLEKFKTSIAEHRNKNRIEEDARLAMSVNATGTPTFFINGRKLVGAMPLAAFKRIINEELNRANQMLEQGSKLDGEFYQKIVKENQKSTSAASSK